MKEKSETEKFEELIRQKQASRFLPYSVTFELTPLCNFQCQMCYIRLDKSEQERRHPLVSTEQWLDLARQAYQSGTLFLTLTGGEILTRPDFREIYETCYDMGFCISILSNGYLLNDSILALFKEKKPHFMRFTIYGASDETYQKVCGVKNGFSVVSENLKKIRDIGIPFETCMTVIKDNEADIERVIQWTTQEGILFHYNTVIRNPVRGAKGIGEEARISWDEISKDEKSDPSQEEKVLFPLRTSHPFSCCRCYKSTCIITWDGRIVGCNYINSISEDAFSQPLVEGFRNLWNRLGQLKQPEKCNTCKYLKFCNPCPGALENESGDPEQTAPYICAFARQNYHDWCVRKEKAAGNLCD